MYGDHGGVGSMGRLGLIVFIEVLADTIQVFFAYIRRNQVKQQLDIALGNHLARWEETG